MRKSVLACLAGGVCLVVSVAVAEGPTTATVAAGAPAAATAKAAVVFGQPILVTDVGQGNTDKLLEAMLKRAGGFELRSDNMAKAGDLDDVKTLVVGVGASTKGLGAAGLNVADEQARTADLLKAAHEKGIPVIGVHIGGVPRRGELSDGFNRMVFEKSTVFVAWSGGNEDGFFTRLAEETKVPLIVNDDKRGVGDELTKLLKEGFAPAAADAATTGTAKE